MAGNFHSNFAVGRFDFNDAAFFYALCGLVILTVDMATVRAD